MIPKTITDQAIRIEKYNTNNAWGFGGGRGTCYHFANGSFLKDGIADFRHLPSQHYVSFTDSNGAWVLDKPKLNTRAIQFILKEIEK